MTTIPLDDGSFIVAFTVQRWAIVLAIVIAAMITRWVVLRVALSRLSHEVRGFGHVLVGVAVLASVGYIVIATLWTSFSWSDAAVAYATSAYVIWTALGVSSRLAIPREPI